MLRALRLDTPWAVARVPLLLQALAATATDLYVAATAALLFGQLAARWGWAPDLSMQGLQPAAPGLASMFLPFCSTWLGAFLAYGILPPWLAPLQVDPGMPAGVLVQRLLPGPHLLQLPGGGAGGCRHPPLAAQQAHRGVIRTEQPWKGHSEQQQPGEAG